MAPKATRNQSPPSDPQGMFAGLVVFLVEKRVQSRRLQIWKQKLVQMGATIEDSLTKRVTHILAMDPEALLQQLGSERLAHFKGERRYLRMYHLKLEADKSSNDYISSDDEPPKPKKPRSSSPDDLAHTSIPKTPESPNKDQVTALQSAVPYSPPDLNKNITQIFGKLINIYRALGDDRRSFSYYKAIAVIEKLPFKIQSVDQLKTYPTLESLCKIIGGFASSLNMFCVKYMLLGALCEIQEIVTTGKLSKLEHFETDEKVLERYYDDIKQRIPRHEAEEMEHLLQKVGENVLPGVVIVCGGSYRRGKASCGDLDIVITHPDGTSHKGFLTKYVKQLKDMKFLREDLIFSTHSEEGTDSGVDTYFGLCTYPGRELRHRIDLKVYPLEIYAFGLIAWTGNDVLNRRLRLLAESKGFRLDDTGLFPATHGSSGSKRGVRASASLKFDTEKEVFDFLGFPWLEPHERNL
ncbi:DNA polymerase lambda isoform X1 [Prunus yedoensis var. nudiflora]|uniref:DNA polymerase n=1 Tax=Prunus yedoensis var. nudiflora TaxID=2094558 RepID=A0A314Y748_PRUYE|nr:DNA polymerase lambda isoform X1 [Prunus yedoensis var. nudiflora]